MKPLFERTERLERGVRESIEFLPVKEPPLELFGACIFLSVIELWWGLKLDLGVSIPPYPWPYT